MAWNLAIDRKRSVLPAQLDEQLALAIVSRELPADEQLSGAGDLARVLAAMDRLPKLERAVLMLTAFEELSVTEIALALGKSQSSVRSLTFRARTHLQERLGQVTRRRGHASKGGPEHAG